MLFDCFSGSINSDVKADGSHNRHNVVNKPRVVGVGDFNNLLKLKMFKYTTIVAALIPMAFVGGLMGPYMRPIPINASTAIALSALIAFTITPWAAYMLLKNVHVHEEYDIREILLLETLHHFGGSPYNLQSEKMDLLRSGLGPYGLFPLDAVCQTGRGKNAPLR